MWIAFAHANSNSHSDCNSNGHSECLGNPYSYGTTVAKGYADSAAAPDCSTSAVSRRN